MDYLPALEDVYDLSTEDLKKIQQQLQQNPNGREDLLETITLEIQERKALQYFAELCHADNPYARKVAAFNQQFLKLAAETIQKNHNARTQGIGSYEPSQLPNNEPIATLKSTSKSQPDIIVQKQSQNNKKRDSVQHRQQTDNDSKSVQSEQPSHSDAISTTTAGSKTQQSTSRVSVQVKMNIGAKKGGKGSKMKQIMQNTLARTLVEDDGIIKRNTGSSPQTVINPHKKYHIPGQKHEATETKSKKSLDNPPNSQKSIKSKEQIKSSKNIKATSQQGKTKKQIAAKIKDESKKGSVKLPKINQYKDLVQMVKEQQQHRKIKANKSHNVEKLPIIDHSNSVQTENQNKQQHKQYIVQQIQNQQIKSFVNQQSDFKQAEKRPLQLDHAKENSQSKVIQKQKIDADDIIEQEQVQESLSPNKIQKLSQKISQNHQKPKDIIINEATQAQNTQSSIKIQQKKIQKSDKRLSQNKIMGQPQIILSVVNKKLHQQVHIERSQESKPQTSVYTHENVNNNEIQANVDYTRKLLQQIQQQQKQAGWSYEKPKTPSIQSYQDKVSDSKTVNQKSSEQITKEKEKKCYSEEYWAHIRQQAELKIKRFKQQKQYEERKQQHKFEKQQSHDNDDIVDDYDSNQGQAISETPNSLLQKIKLQQKAFKQQMAKKNEQINKIKRDLMKKTNKKVAEAAPQKIISLRPRPEFDYLSVYPSFNHIFSVMYLKPVHQALNDIPNIMRDIKTLFTAHMEHFSNRSNFKPAIFLPFDNNGAFQLTDAKQLIAHAQETYIDLKVMIERVEIFNQNLHGQFNNASEDKYYRVIKTKEEVYDIITTSFMRRKGWKELPHGCSLRTSWNLFWSWSKPDVVLNKLLIWQRINHFPFNKNLSRKDLLYKNLDSFRKIYKVPMNFLPLTFNLPKQFSQLSAKFHEQEMINRDNNYWIMKPIGKSRGRGIKVVSSLSQLNYTDNIVVQKYIINPMLIDGYKFDMRIYVLVTSFHPLEAFVYREGFARLSTEKYTLDAHSIKNTFVHLTNFAINKNNVSSNTNFAGGSKISLKTLKDKITRMGHSFSNIWSQVHDIIIKSLLGCSVSVPSFPTAFELFGYDIMVDQQCNCHLIQINASPSLQRSYMIDEIVKQNLIDDIIDLVDPADFDKRELIEVFNQRIQSITNKKKITPQEDLIGLARILKYKPIRKIGEKPNKMGLFQVVAPCDSSREIQVLIKAKSGANNPMNID